MNRVCYKVVSDFGRIYASAMRGIIASGYLLRYKIGKITTPKRGRIFVFQDLHFAKAFARTYGPYRILKGIATNVGKPKYLCSRFCSSKSLNQFWKLKKRRYGVNNSNNLCVVPKGTLSCSSFTPTELVK